MKTLTRLGAILFTTSCLQASDVNVGDPDLPQPLDLSFAETMVSNSPFTRSVNLEESLQLTGIAYVDGRPVATVLNTLTKERFVVSEEPNALGWRLTGAVAGTDLINTQVEMMVGPELLRMHYHQVSPGGMSDGSSQSRLAKGNSSKKSSKSSLTAILGDNGRELYASLSPDGRGKFKELIKSQLDKKPDMTPEQSSAYAQKVFAKIKQTDHPSTSGSPSPKSPKSGKPSKKKQGA